MHKHVLKVSCEKKKQNLFLLVYRVKKTLGTFMHTWYLLLKKKQKLETISKYDKNKKKKKKIKGINYAKFRFPNQIQYRINNSSWWNCTFRDLSKE